jgi:hypothetical protein
MLKYLYDAIKAIYLNSYTERKFFISRHNFILLQKKTIVDNRMSESTDQRRLSNLVVFHHV